MIEELPHYGHGLVLTAKLSLVSLSGSMILGLLAGVLRVAPLRLLRAAGLVYVEAFRNVPPLLLLFFVFFALPRRGIVLDPFPSAAVALSVYGGAFIAEAVRGGILAVNPRHVEMARALGLGHLQALRWVVLPIALAAALPALTNVLIALVKTTALAGSVGVNELMSETKAVQADTFQIFDAYAMAAGAYLILIAPLSLFSAMVERRSRQFRGGA